MPGKMNGFFVSSNMAKSAVTGLVMLGVWVGTIQADLGDKAEKIDLAVQVATQTETLKSLNATMTAMNKTVTDIAEKQRETELKVAKLEAKDEE